MAEIDHVADGIFQIEGIDWFPTHDPKRFSQNLLRVLTLSI